MTFQLVLVHKIIERKNTNEKMLVKLFTYRSEERRDNLSIFTTCATAHQSGTIVMCNRIQESLSLIFKNIHFKNVYWVI